MYNFIEMIDFINVISQIVKTWYFDEDVKYSSELIIFDETFVKTKSFAFWIFQLHFTNCFCILQ